MSADSAHAIRYYERRWKPYSWWLKVTGRKCFIHQWHLAVRLIKKYYILSAMVLSQHSQVPFFYPFLFSEEASRTICHRYLSSYMDGFIHYFSKEGYFYPCFFSQACSVHVFFLPYICCRSDLSIHFFSTILLLQVRALCEKAKEILMEESNVQV